MSFLLLICISMTHSSRPYQTIRPSSVRFFSSSDFIKWKLIQIFNFVFIKTHVKEKRRKYPIIRPDMEWWLTPLLHTLLFVEKTIFDEPPTIDDVLFQSLLLRKKTNHFPIVHLFFFSLSLKTFLFYLYEKDLFRKSFFSLSHFLLSSNIHK